jgi:peptidoglycan/LPS O-acetylase OafA/YrhL
MVGAGVPATALIIGLWIVTSAAVLPLALLSYRYVELPAIALGRRLSARPAGDVALRAQLHADSVGRAG